MGFEDLIKVTQLLASVVLYWFCFIGTMTSFV